MYVKHSESFPGVSFSRSCHSSLHHHLASLPLIPFSAALPPAFAQWTLHPPHQMTLPLFLPLPPLLPPLLQINSPQPPNSPMDCQFATPPPALSNPSACRHIRSRITVVCAEVRYRAMSVSVSFVLKATSASALN